MLHGQKFANIMTGWLEIYDKDCTTGVVLFCSLTAEPKTTVRLPVLSMTTKECFQSRLYKEKSLTARRDAEFFIKRISFILYNISFLLFPCHYLSWFRKKTCGVKWVDLFNRHKAPRHVCYDCRRCLNSSQHAPTSVSARKSFGMILANISLKPTEFASGMLLSLKEASSVSEAIK